MLLYRKLNRSFDGGIEIGVFSLGRSYQSYLSCYCSVLDRTHRTSTTLALALTRDSSSAQYVKPRVQSWIDSISNY